MNIEDIRKLNNEDLIEVYELKEEKRKLKQDLTRYSRQK